MDAGRDDVVGVEGADAAGLDALVDDWITLPDVAERLGQPVTRVRQLLRERKLIAVRRTERQVLMVPAAFLDGAAIVKGLPGCLTVLADNRFTDAEAVRWLFTPDDTLPGRPIDALAANRGTEVKRRAQASG